MKLEISPAVISRKGITVDYLNADRQFSVTIPIAEFEEWLNVEGIAKDSSHDEVDRFVEEYLQGYVNIDPTAHHLLSLIYKYIDIIKPFPPFKYKGNNAKLLVIDKSQYFITKSKYGLYRLFKDRIEQKSHELIIYIFTTLVKAVSEHEPAYNN